uniref:Uncharacterized protein n=1 Tax=Anguilla anguilla TaxID=7936 RepID=A0A0E9TG46_ANGAN
MTGEDACCCVYSHVRYQWNLSLTTSR